MRIIEDRRHCFISLFSFSEHNGQDGSNEVTDNEALKH
jgi:hypothetical protein